MLHVVSFATFHYVCSALFYSCSLFFFLNHNSPPSLGEVIPDIWATKYSIDTLGTFENIFFHRNRLIVIRMVSLYTCTWVNLVWFHESGLLIELIKTCSLLEFKITKTSSSFYLFNLLNQKALQIVQFQYVTLYVQLYMYNMSKFLHCEAWFYWQMSNKTSIGRKVFIITIICNRNVRRYFNLFK